MSSRLIGPIDCRSRTRSRWAARGNVEPFKSSYFAKTQHRANQCTAKSLRRVSAPAKHGAQGKRIHALSAEGFHYSRDLQAEIERLRKETPVPVRPGESALLNGDRSACIPPERRTQLLPDGHSGIPPHRGEIVLVLDLRLTTRRSSISRKNVCFITSCLGSVPHSSTGRRRGRGPFNSLLSFAQFLHSRHPKVSTESRRD